MDFDYTPGGAAATSYISEEEATSYFVSRLHSSLWEDFEEKQSALITSTRLLDQWVTWAGIKSTEQQNLDWPREGVVDKDNYFVPDDVIPQNIKDACCEMAYSILEDDRTLENDMKGFKSMKVGSLQLVADKFDRASTIPESVWRSVGELGKMPHPSQVPVIRR